MDFSVQAKTPILTLTLMHTLTPTIVTCKNCPLTLSPENGQDRKHTLLAKHKMPNSTQNTNLNSFIANMSSTVFSKIWSTNILGKNITAHVDIASPTGGDNVILFWVS